MHVVFASPEVLKNGRWIQCMRGYRDRVRLVAVDEMHCLSDW